MFIIYQVILTWIILWNPVSQICYRPIICLIILLKVRVFKVQIILVQTNLLFFFRFRKFLEGQPHVSVEEDEQQNEAPERIVLDFFELTDDDSEEDNNENY